MDVCHSFGFSFIGYNGNTPRRHVMYVRGRGDLQGRPAMDGTASPIAQLVRAPH